MKIAQIIPSSAKSSSEAHDVIRVATSLSRQLVVQGNDVTLLTSCNTEAERAPADASKRKRPGIAEVIAHGNFDIVHVHGDPLSEMCLRYIDVPIVATFYRYPQALDILSRKLQRVPLVAVSYHQRASLEDACWEVTIPCGLSHARERFTIDPQAYLAYVGSISPTGGIQYAVEVAARSNMRLRVAGSVSASERRYFNRVIAPLIESSAARVEFVGGRNAEDASALVSRARALLFMTEWPDPCPLALLDALACGTPVIARFTGSIPEIIEHESSGFLVDDIDAAVRVVGQLDALNRLACRRRFDERFAVEVIARRYLTLYRHLQHNYEMARITAMSQAQPPRELSRR